MNETEQAAWAENIQAALEGPCVDHNYCWHLSWTGAVACAIARYIKTGGRSRVRRDDFVMPSGWGGPRGWDNGGQQTARYKVERYVKSYYQTVGP